MTVLEAVTRDYSPSRIPVIDVYARVSRASDKRMRSTAGQVTECTAVLNEKGFIVGVIHIDNSKSAWDERVFRPAWEAVMTRLETGQCDGVIIFELTRFTRRSKEGMRLLDAAKNGLLIMDSEKAYDLTTGSGRKAFRDAISDAEAESDKISMRTGRGKRTKARDNKEYNCSTRAFGFEVGNIIPREDEASELVAAAKKLLAGIDQQAICDDLNARGILTTAAGQTKVMRNGKELVITGEWKHASLRQSLTRLANVGDVPYKDDNGEEQVYRDAHSGIMDRDLYDQVCALYNGRKRGRPISNLATGFIQCAECGRGMHGKDLHAKCPPYPDGSPQKIYLCVKRNGGCGQTIDWYDLNCYVKELALTRLSDPRQAGAIAAKAAAADDELAAVSAKIADLTRIVEDLDARIGQMGLKRYDKAVKPIEEQLQRLAVRQAELQASAPDRAVTRKLESRAVWEKRWRAGDLNARREIVRRGFGGRVLQVSPGPRLMPADARCSFPVEADSESSGVGHL